VERSPEGPSTDNDRPVYRVIGGGGVGQGVAAAWRPVGRGCVRSRSVGRNSSTHTFHRPPTLVGRRGMRAPQSNFSCTAPCSLPGPLLGLFSVSSAEREVAGRRVRAGRRFLCRVWGRSAQLCSVICGRRRGRTYACGVGFEFLSPKMKTNLSSWWALRSTGLYCALVCLVDSTGESVLISRHPLARSHPHAIPCPESRGTRDHLHICPGRSPVMRPTPLYHTAPAPLPVASCQGVCSTEATAQHGTFPRTCMCTRHKAPVLIAPRPRVS
jgi:hypothetical protein